MEVRHFCREGYKSATLQFAYSNPLDARVPLRVGEFLCRHRWRDVEGIRFTWGFFGVTWEMKRHYVDVKSKRKCVLKIDGFAVHVIIRIDEDPVMWFFDKLRYLEDWIFPIVVKISFLKFILDEVNFFLASHN